VQHVLLEMQMAVNRLRAAAKAAEAMADRAAKPEAASELRDLAAG